MRVHAATTGVLGIVGAVLVMVLTVQADEAVIFKVVLWSLTVLLAVLDCIQGGRCSAEQNA